MAIQRQAIAEHFARLLDRLGLDEVPPKALTLREFLQQKAAEKQKYADAVQEDQDEGREPADDQEPEGDLEQ